MISNRFLILFAGLFAFLMLVSSASAGPLTLTPNPITLNEVHHDVGEITFTFNLTNGLMDEEGLDWSMSSTSRGSWTTLPTLNMILGSQVITGLTAVLQVPEHTSGQISATIEVESDTGATAQLPITISFLNEPSIELTQTDAITRNDQTGSVLVKNTGNTVLSGISLDNLANDDFEVTFSINGFTLNAGDSRIVTVTPTQNLSNIGFEGATANIRATSGSVSDDLALNVAGSFCRYGEQGTSNISISSIDVRNRGDSEDSEDDIWVLRDEVTIEVDVENLMDNDDLKDITVEIGLFDSDGKNVADKLEFDSSSSDEEKDDIGRINDDDTETSNFRFFVPPDFDEGDYTLVIKAYDDGDEDVTCTEEEESTINIRPESQEERFVIVDDFTFPSEAVCNDVVSGEFTVFNVGDQDQDQVEVRIRNTDLGIDEALTIRDLRTGDEDTVQFTFNVPGGVSEKTYNLDFRTYYDYDEDDDEYNEISEDTFIHRLKVFGCGNSGNGNVNAQVSASLVSDSVRAGSNAEVEARITNTGSQTATFILSASGYDSWADSASLSERTLVLAPGQSETVVINLEVSKGASGTQSFMLDVIQGSNTKTVEIEVPGIRSSGFSFELSASNALVWILGAAIIILLILIIVVAIRLARR